MAKTKVSVKIDEAILERVDRLASESSRSEIFERALKEWLNERRRRDLEDEIGAYYDELEESERQEDREWAGFGARQAGKTWS